MVEEAHVMESLQTVEDPELDISIVDLGLVYGVRFEHRDEGLHAEIKVGLGNAVFEVIVKKCKNENGVVGI